MSGISYDFAIQQLIRAGELDEETALRFGETGLLDAVAMPQLLERLAMLNQLLTRRQVRSALYDNPANILHPLERLGNRIIQVQTALACPKRDAIDILIRCLSALNLPDDEFEKKLLLIREIVPSRRDYFSFLDRHAAYFLIPMEALWQKRHLRFEGSDPDTVWAALTLEPGGTHITLDSFAVRIKPAEGRWKQYVQHRTARSIAARMRQQTRQATEQTLPEGACHYPLKQPVLQRVIRRDLTDAEAAECYLLLEFLTQEHTLGIHHDHIYAYVLNRPWLVDPRNNTQELLRQFVKLGFRDSYLRKVLSHDGLLELGYDLLEPVLQELINNRAIPLPTDLDDLAILPSVFRRRLRILTERDIPAKDPRVKKALYEKTEETFLLHLAPKSPSTV